MHLHNETLRLLKRVSVAGRLYTCEIGVDMFSAPAGRIALDPAVRVSAKYALYELGSPRSPMASRKSDYTEIVGKFFGISSTFRTKKQNIFDIICSF